MVGLANIGIDSEAEVAKESVRSLLLDRPRYVHTMHDRSNALALRWRGVTRSRWIYRTIDVACAGDVPDFPVAVALSALLFATTGRDINGPEEFGTTALR